MLKQYTLLILIVCIALSLVFVVSAHSGKTDSNGGHLNHSTGEYHYHHGYPEHQHTNGECPYNFKDKTDHSHKETNTPSAFWNSIEDGFEYLVTLVKVLAMLTLPLVIVWLFICSLLEKLANKLLNHFSENTLSWISVIITVIIGVLLAIWIVDLFHL